MWQTVKLGCQQPSILFVFVYMFGAFVCVCVKHMTSAASEMGCVLLCVPALSSAVITVFEIYDSNVYSVTSRPSAAVIGKEPCCQMKM